MANPATALDQLLMKLIASDGTPMPTRSTLNFAAGATLVDNPGTDSTDVTISGGGGGSNLYGPYGSRPASGTAGRVYFTNDGPVSFVDTGSAWRPWLPGFPGSEVAPSNVNPFTSVGATLVGTTVGTVGGCVTMTAPEAGGSHSFQGNEVVLPGGSGCQAFLVAQGSNVGSVGVYVREHVSGKILMIGIDWNSTVQNWVVQYFNGFSAGSGSAVLAGDFPSSGIRQPIGVRIRNDGVLWNFEYSRDGVSWVTLYEEALTTHLTSGADRAGIYIDPFSSHAEITLMTWDLI